MRSLVRARRWPRRVAPARPATRARRTCSATGEREVRALHFDGNETFSDDELSARVLTTPSSFAQAPLRGSSARRAAIPVDGLAPDIGEPASMFYRNNGFYDTQVDTARDAVGPTARRRDLSHQRRAAAAPRLARDRGLDSVADTRRILRDLQLRVGERVGRAHAVRRDDRHDHVAAAQRRLSARRQCLRRSTRTWPSIAPRSRFEVAPGVRARIRDDRVSTSRRSARRPPRSTARSCSACSASARATVQRRRAADAQRNLYHLGVYRHVDVRASTRTWAHGDSVADVSTSICARTTSARSTPRRAGRRSTASGSTRSYTDKNFLDEARRLELTARLSKIGYGEPTRDSATREPVRPAAPRPGQHRELEAELLPRRDDPAADAVRPHWVRRPTRCTPSGAASIRRICARRTSAVERRRRATIGASMPLRVGVHARDGQTAGAAGGALRGVQPLHDRASRPSRSGRLRLAVASASLQRIRPTIRVEPTRGYIIAGELRGAAPLIGSDPSLQFVKGTVDDRPVPAGVANVTFVVAARDRRRFDQRVRRVDGAKLPPPQERLYAGGANERARIPAERARSDRLPAENGAVRRRHGRPHRRERRPRRTCSGDAESTANANDAGRRQLARRVQHRAADPRSVLPGAARVRAVRRRRPGVDRRSPNVNELQPVAERARDAGRWACAYYSPVGPIQVERGVQPVPAPAGPGVLRDPVDPTHGVGAAHLCDAARERRPSRREAANGSRADYQAAAVRRRSLPPRSHEFLQRLTFTFSIGTELLTA